VRLTLGRHRRDFPLQLRLLLTNFVDITLELPVLGSDLALPFSGPLDHLLALLAHLFVALPHLVSEAPRSRLDVIWVVEAVVVPTSHTAPPAFHKIP
jgi:hypothetical protein